MKTIIIVILLVSLSIQNAVLLSSSPDNTIVSVPSKHYTVYEEYYEKNHPNYLGYNAHWIYKNGTGSRPLNDYATFCSTFHADCTS